MAKLPRSRDLTQIEPAEYLSARNCGKLCGVEPAGVPKRASKDEKLRLFREGKQTVELINVKSRNGNPDFSAARKEWGHRSESCGLYLNETFPTVGFKRGDVVAESIATRLSHMLYALSQLTFSRAPKPFVLIMHDEFFTSTTNRTIARFNFEIVAADNATRSNAGKRRTFTITILRLRLLDELRKFFSFISRCFHNFCYCSPQVRSFFETFDNNVAQQILKAAERLVASNVWKADGDKHGADVLVLLLDRTARTVVEELLNFSIVLGLVERLAAKFQREHFKIIPNDYFDFFTRPVVRFARLHFLHGAQVARLSSSFFSQINSRNRAASALS